MSGKIINAIKAIHDNVQYCIGLNGLYTNWFHVKHGLKQGYLFITASLQHIYL